MARLILSNLCLSFSILLLNTVLCKTPSTLISSWGDLIKLVCSFLGLFSHFNHTLLPATSSPEMLPRKPACRQPYFYFQGSWGPFSMCFSAFSQTLVCTNVATAIVPCFVFYMATQNKLNTVLGGRGCVYKIAPPLNLIAHQFPTKVWWKHLEMTDFF